LGTRQDRWIQVGRAESPTFLLSYLSGGESGTRLVSERHFFLPQCRFNRHRTSEGESPRAEYNEFEGKSASTDDQLAESPLGLAQKQLGYFYRPGWHRHLSANCV